MSKKGIVIIDVVEGTAIEALPFMESVVMSRPKTFASIEDAIKWVHTHSIVKNKESARVSVPPKLVEIKDGEKTKY